MENNERLDARISRLCNRLKVSEQESQNVQTDVIEELSWILESSANREDIAAFIEEIKTDIKADESRHWEILDRWGQHFDGITSIEEESEKDDTDSDEKDTDNDQ